MGRPAWLLAVVAVAALVMAACVPPPESPPPTTVDPELVVVLSPEPAVTTSTLTCTPSGLPHDPSVIISYTYQWSVDGEPTGATGPALSGVHFARGDSVTCEVTAFPGGETASATIVISNSPPVVISLDISPAAPGPSDDLTCSAVVRDVDGDAVVVSYSWSVGGGPPVAGQVLPAGTFGAGDEVTCTAVADDGIEPGAPASTTVTIPG